MVSLLDFYEQSPPRDIPEKLRRRVLLGGRTHKLVTYGCLFPLLLLFVLLFVIPLSFFVLFGDSYERIVAGVSFGIVILGAACIPVILYKKARSTLSVLETGMLTEGRILRSWVVYGEGDVGKIVVRFFDGNDERTKLFELRPKFVSRFPSGTQIKLLYDPERPNRVVVPELLLVACR